MPLLKSSRSRAGYSASVVLLIVTGGLAGTVLIGASDSWSGKRAAPPPPELASLHADPPLADGAGFDAAGVQAVVDRYCVRCHSDRRRMANLVLDTLDASAPASAPAVWENVVSKLRTGTMPPSGSPRPDEATYDEVAGWLETTLDEAWFENPHPGRITAIHRLNRTEYNNVIRDLFGLDVDVTGLLPGDETADGTFDNLAGMLTISTAHLERYMSVARQVTRMAVGLPPEAPDFRIFRVNEILEQTDLMSEDLPLGSRGGMAVRHHFPADGEYVIRASLTTNYAEYLKGMGWPQQIEFRLDGELLGRFTTGGDVWDYRPAGASYEGAGSPGFEGDWEWEAYMQGEADDHLEVRTFVTGGPHVLGVSFPMYMWESETLLPQPPLRIWGKTLKDDATYMGLQGLNDVMVEGPFAIAGSADRTESRARVFVCEPEDPSQETGCATRIIERMASRAFRRAVSSEEVQNLLAFYHDERAEGGTFDEGVQFALERVLVDPDFLLRVYRDPPSVEAATYNRQVVDGYLLSDMEIASRLAFFLWSSIPDDTLLDLAERGLLTQPEVLEEQVARMLDDPRASEALTHGFASQWLNLRVLEEKVADEDLFPDFDANLLEAMRLETELFVANTIEEDQSVLTLLNADYTYLNERLARHYGISGIYGSRMRRVQLPDLTQRGGVLGHASLLSLTAYPNRTSPVLRGKWLLDNILGAPVPAPPPDVDTSLDEGDFSADLTLRQRLEQHRDNPSCASCHSRMDPLGFALESFDAVGAWREVDLKRRPVDDVGRWPGGEDIGGFTGLRSMLLDSRELFVRNLTYKLMTYALGRRVEYYDQPSIRKIVRDAEAEGYSWSAILSGIVETPAFLMRAPTEHAAQH